LSYDDLLTYVENLGIDTTLVISIMNNTIDPLRNKISKRFNSAELQLYNKRF